MPANGLLYARRSGQGDLEPDGEAVAGVRRILRGPPISVLREEARELLAPVYGWFTEGFDTLDLKARGQRRWEMRGN